MRTFNFKARNIGEEKYLTYTMGEECEWVRAVRIIVMTMMLLNCLI